MRRKGGLTRSQIICIVLLWIVLCVMLFTLPSDNTLWKNIFYAVASGLIIFFAINKDQNRQKQRRRDEINKKMKDLK